MSPLAPEAATAQKSIQTAACFQPKRCANAASPRGSAQNSATPAAASATPGQRLRQELALVNAQAMPRPTATMAADSLAPSAPIRASTPSAFTQRRSEAKAANAHKNSGNMKTSG